MELRVQTMYNQAVPAHTSCIQASLAITCAVIRGEWLPQVGYRVTAQYYWAVQVHALVDTQAALNPPGPRSESCSDWFGKSECTLFSHEMSWLLAIPRYWHFPN